ncbi:hypothetical protein LTR37_004410 [Vermiconidia calcicola]|uniref:Uncharacterized protein n=1 Tax=Vermiconidia calcicola TaxID=1690605 RepID=A0ACC3NNT8_9PEZI|nr:hypothetical protein LTR37_004410 [Vermiconidia calcicola]
MPKRKGVELKRPDAKQAKSAKRNGDTGSRPSKDSDELIRKLNDMSTHEFREEYIEAKALERDAKETQISLKASNELTKQEFNACFDLVSTTSRLHYEGSAAGWNPKQKKREMMQQEMRYLLVYPSKHSDQSSNEGSASADPHGYLSYMLTHDSTPVVPALYVYEIHLTEDMRKKGVGTHLMDLAEDIAANVGMKKVMLTCFLTNAKALHFYEKLGYAKDASSPEDRKTRKALIKVDYVILSKSSDRLP